MRVLQSLFAPLVRLVRRALGICCLILAVLGFILPILPGWPFIVPAVLLLGRRDPMLRHMHMVLRHTLRYLRRSSHPSMRLIGMRLSSEYTRGKRALVPHIDAAERAMRLR